MNPENVKGVNVYPVGALAYLLRIKAALSPTPSRLMATLIREGHAPADWRRQHVASALYLIRRHWRRRSTWNGYLAEPTVDILWTRCGHGWTKGRALRSLKRHVGEVQW
jgi:hypothetical protein